MDAIRQELIKAAYRLFFDYCTAACRADVYTYLKTVPAFTDAERVKWCADTTALIKYFESIGETHHSGAINSICAHWATQVNQPHTMY